MRELAVGQKVICKYRNTRYYHSDVVELTTATFYEVVFDDGSYSDNLLPEDIEVYIITYVYLSTVAQGVNYERQLKFTSQINVHI